MDFQEVPEPLIGGPFSILKFGFLSVTLYRETTYFLIITLVIGKPCCARYFMYCRSAASSSPSKIGAGPLLFVGYIPFSLSARVLQGIPKSLATWLIDNFDFLQNATAAASSSWWYCSFEIYLENQKSIV